MSDAPSSAQPHLGVMPLGGGKRLALAPEALWIEYRGKGQSWVRQRAIGYDEIRVVYRYEVRDWLYLVVAGGYWLGGLMLALLWWYGAGLSMARLYLLSALVTVAAGGWAAYRIGTRPRRLLRIDAYSGAMVVSDREPAFFSQLAARLLQTAPEPERTAVGGPELATEGQFSPP